MLPVMIIAILSLKGGVGKTTTCMHLAAVAHERRKRPVVLDADTNRSALHWQETAQAADITLPFAVQVAEHNTLAQQARALEKAGHLVVIDCPPNNEAILVRAANLADRVVVPTKPTGLDMDQLGGTAQLLADIEATKGQLDSAILLTHYNARRRLARETLEALSGYPVLKTHIRYLAKYEESFGTIPRYLEEYKGVFKELGVK